MINGNFSFCRMFLRACTTILWSPLSEVMSYKSAYNFGRLSRFNFLKKLKVINEMEVQTQLATSIIINDKPVVNEAYEFNSWKVNFKSSHILPSKCLPTCTEETRCSFCFYNNELELPHMPEMVYPHNVLSLTHQNGSHIEFNALDALRAINNEKLSKITIACAEEWKSARKETGLVEKTVGLFDWTFSSDYSGTIKGWSQVEETDTAIDLERLKQKEQILLYKALTLYEDELHDNGISLCSVRIRVMPSSFFILLRHFLRVDGVILCVHDSRFYHDFLTDYVIKETSYREGRVSELKLPISIMNEPDEVTPLLPLKYTKNKKLVFNST